MKIKFQKEFLNYFKNFMKFVKYFRVKYIIVRLYVRHFLEVQ